MKTRLSIFLLCLCLSMVWLLRVQSYLGEESSVGNPGNISGLLGDGSDARSSGGSMFTDATFANGSSGGNAFSVVGVGGQNAFSSSRRSHAPVFSYARMSESASPSSLITSSPQGGSSSPIGHMTSSAEYHSFGGGMVAVGGYASSASNVVASSSSNLAAYSQSPVSYGQLSVANRPASLRGSMDEVMPVVDQSFAVASSSYVSPLSVEYAYDSYGTASYGGSHNRIGGRQNAPPAGGGGGLGNSWLNWLDNVLGTSTTFDDEASARAAYDQMLASWNHGMGDPPSFEDFLAWLKAGGNDGYTTKGGNTYKYAPVGNVLPLLLMALIYAIVLFVKRNKTAQI